MVGAEHVFGSAPPPCSTLAEMEAKIMSDLQVSAEAQLAYEIARRATEPDACARWAHAADTPDGPMLWPRDRGPASGPGYRISTLTARRGLMRILLSRSAGLSGIGVDIDTQLALLGAEQVESAQVLTGPQVDQVIQVGLFGEVFY